MRPLTSLRTLTMQRKGPKEEILAKETSPGMDQKVFGLKDVVSVVAGEATKKDKGKSARGNTTTSDQNR